MSSFFDVYNPLESWKKGDSPLSPKVCVKLAMYHQAANGQITLGPDMANDDDVDDAIDRLIENLEEVRKAAKKALRSMRQKQLT